tara:strand:- start:364 stop:1161 length:798 start_codon:yes stop_codon:yes gene_type:complete
MADISEKIEKQMEGTNLALAAVAEVLQKMDGRLAKEEQAVQAAEVENANAAARADLVKSIAKEVIGLIKEGSEAGLDVDGGERKAKATGGTPQNADDSEAAVTPTTKIEDQQNTIQAMRKQDEDEEEEMEKEGTDEADEEAADEPVAEKGMDEDDEEDESDEMKSMAKQLAKLTKELEATKSNMQKAVTAESESRLRKMGFREETGLQAPKIVNGLGLDDTPVLQKSGSGDPAEQLASLSYSELRRLQHQIETGNTDGVPRELLG